MNSTLSTAAHPLPLPIALLLFTVSLLTTVRASAWFTRRLEDICRLLNLPPRLLSLLGALGANIPNYVASIVAIAGGQMGTGLGIIIGSNIYNIAIILSIATFATSKNGGIVLTAREAQDARTIARYTLAIMFTTLLAVWMLPGTPFVAGLHVLFMTKLLLIAASLLTLAIFSALAFHAIHHVHPTHNSVITPSPGIISSVSIIRWIVEALLALGIALGGVIVMVQSGQAFTIELHIPQVLAGLLVLAVATSLPNTVTAYILATTNQTSACVEEIFSSNSINAALGLALPLLLWQDMMRNQLLLFLDTPLMVILTLVALVCVLRRRVSQVIGIFLVLIYATWVVVHVFVQ